MEGKPAERLGWQNHGPRLHRRETKTITHVSQGSFKKSDHNEPVNRLPTSLFIIILKKMR